MKFSFHSYGKADTEPAAIRVVGKGGKQRLVPLSPTVGLLLEAWMALRGDSAGPLFCPIDRTGILRLGHTLTGEAIRQILARRTLAAGVVAVSPHDLRRTYAGDLLDAGADLPAVQQLMGHASPSTTSRYDRRGDKARRSAAERLRLDLDDPAQPGAGDDASETSCDEEDHEHRVQAQAGAVKDEEHRNEKSR